jgi:DNA-directed RNA polymerase subunit RPC12/RpoP
MTPFDCAQCNQHIRPRLGYPRGRCPLGKCPPLAQISPSLPEGDGAKCPNCGKRGDDSDVGCWDSTDQLFCESCGTWFVPEESEAELAAWLAGVEADYQAGGKRQGELWA